MIQKMFVYLISFVILAGCVDFTDAVEPSEPAGSAIAGTKQIEIVLDYNYDVDTYDNYHRGNIYVIWLENSAGVKQHLYICERLLSASYPNIIIALPYWRLNKYVDDNWVDNKTGIDAVTGATKAQDDFTFPDTFSSLNSKTIPNTISSELGDVFTLYVEMDQSSQFNDWFNIASPGSSSTTVYDEPAVLYSVEIDLNNIHVDPYELTAIGWTPHVEFSNFIEDGGSTTTLTPGVRVDEMSYIENEKSGNSFGAVKPSCSATTLISSIKATVSDIP